MIYLFVGIPDSKEYYIGSGRSFYYLYDFTIPKFNVIIEYNNERWHPRPYMYNEDLNYININGNNANYLYKRDIDKNKEAKKRGFNILEIWSDINIEENIEKCKNFIKENIDNE